jgi:hypothetical protein
MFYGMNFDILTNKKARLDGYRPTALMCWQTAFYGEKGLLAGGHKMPRHYRNENLFLIAWPFPAQNIL